METNLKKLVLTVEDFLESINVNVPFFIAGGSVYSTINGSNHYDDIDVFFYNREDCESVTNRLNVQTSMDVMDVTFDEEPVIHTGPSAYITSNAISVQSLHRSVLARQIQFVKLHVGSVQDIFNKFDLNCSKVAFTSEQELIYGKEYTKNLTVDARNINGMILNRYYKYKSKKNCEDVGYESLKIIIKFLIDNYDKELDTGYTSEPAIHCYKLLNSALHNTASARIAQYAHDYIVTKDELFRLGIFLNATAFMNMKIENRCDELYLYLMLRAIDIPEVYSCEMRQSVKQKYPEYFI